MLQIELWGGYMTQHRKFEGSSSSTEWGDLKSEDCVKMGEEFLSAENDFLGETKVLDLGVKLIEIYDSVFSSADLRQRAFKVVCGLAIRQPGILELVIKNAERYAAGQQVDDAFPYSPNSFEVLANTGKGNTRVIAYLRSVLEDQYGTPRWAAIEALCQLGDSEATRILADVVRGAYHPPKLALSDDLLIIERNLGKSFVEKYRN
jgi:hypothetical protein